MLLVCSCASVKYQVKDIQSGQFLKKAVVVSPDFYFEKRMTNEEFYKFGGIRRWNIILEDQNFTYFGFTIHSSLGDVDTPAGELDTFYKVSKTQLEKRFPKYKDFQGYHLRKRIWNAMDHGLDSKLLSEAGSWRYKREYVLSEKTIDALISIHYNSLFLKTGPELIRYSLSFDKNTLALSKKHRAVLSDKETVKRIRQKERIKF